MVVDHFTSCKPVCCLHQCHGINSFSNTYYKFYSVIQHYLDFLNILDLGATIQGKEEI